MSATTSLRLDAFEVGKRDSGHTLELGPRLVGSAIRHFDSFVLDLRSRELRTDNRSVVLQAQPFEILLLLLGRAGQVVDREELRRLLWPAGTFVDYEHSLNAAIKRLRSALGDDADRPRFIETVPRRGYRFVAPVIENGAMRSRPLSANTHSIRLAVLPVTHVGADTAFAEGLTDEIRAQVGRMSAGAVAVIARSSSMMFEGRPRRASEIGEALRADYLLEGSVRGDGDRVRITVCLVETLGETHVWSDSVECRASGPLSTQVEVATRFAQSVIRKLLVPA
jgi:DNA-binding winged helix-turn-helix (wHTH) protein